jgi:DHA2 family multidrug resistance protein
MLATLTSQSSAADLMPGLCLRGLSLGFLFIPLTTGSLADLSPKEIGAGSGIINLTRQLGGSIGIAVLSALIDQRSTLHRDRLSAHVDAGNSVVSSWLNHAVGSLHHSGLSGVAAHDGALARLAGVIQREALVLSYNDMFLLIGLAFLLATPLIYLTSSKKAGVNMQSAH